MVNVFVFSIFVCFVVATCIYDLVHDVEAIFYLPTTDKSILIFFFEILMMPVKLQFPDAVSS